MGFKKMDHSLDFADFALASSLEANRSLKFTPLNRKEGGSGIGGCHYSRVHRSLHGLKTAFNGAGGKN